MKNLFFAATMFFAISAQAQFDEAFVKKAMFDDAGYLEVFPDDNSLQRITYAPAARVWRFKNTKDIEAHTTRTSVGKDSGLIIYTDKGEDPGEMVIYDVDVNRFVTRGFKGISFWLKGDGGDGELSIGIGITQNNPDNTIAGKFPLSNTEWQKIFIPWDKFTPSVVGKSFKHLNLKFVLPAPRRAWAVVQRFELFEEEEVEQISPVSTPDEPGLIDAAQFVFPSPSEAVKLLPKTMAKLQDKKPLTIVAIGDSITAGAQMWYAGDPGPQEMGYLEYMYYSVLKQKLATHFGYEKSRTVLKMFTADSNLKVPGFDKTAMDKWIYVNQDIDKDDPELKFDGLQLIAVGASGKNSRFGYEHLDEARQYKPDLVIWFHGTNDLGGSNPTNYDKYTRLAVEKLQSDGTEVIVCSPIGFVAAEEVPVVYVKAGMKLAKDLQIPYVCQWSALFSRGRRYYGDLLSDDVHPNEYGNRLLGTTLAAVFGLPDQKIWDQPMFKAMAEGVVIP